jgi:iron(III) transport system substrate-binding protein
MTFTRRRFARTSLSLAALACSGAALAQSASQTITIYTSAPSEIQKALVPAIRAKLGLEVQLVSAGGGELMKRLRAERARPLADLVVSTGGDVIDANPDLFEPYAVRELDQINKAYRVSPHWTPFTVTIPTVLLVNTRLVPAAEMPSRWADLADPKWKGKIAAANSSNGSFQAQVAVMKQLLGDTQTTAWLTGLFANDVQFFGSHSDVRKAVGSGEFALGLVNHYYYELQAHEQSDNNVGVSYPDAKEGQMGVILNTTAVGIIKGAPHAQAAQLFSAFLFLPETQSLFAKLNYEYPIIPGVATSEGLTSLDSIKTVQIDMQSVATNVADAVQMMQSAGIP